MLKKRTSIRLKYYNYSQNGSYFITICAHKNKEVFSKIVGQGLAPAEVSLSAIGQICKEELIALENRYKHIKIDKYVIMPNHIHFIITIKDTAGASPRPTIVDIICAYKSIVTIKINKVFNKADKKIFQSSFFDHVIRNEKNYIKICEYIINNPLNWHKDKYYAREI